MAGHRSALVVVVDEAESAVADLRLRLDPVAPLGVPAHVTVLFPFMPVPEIDDDVLVRLSGVFAPLPAFGHGFRQTGWFGDEVLWLAAEPADPFVSLTRLASEAFPDWPPYEGRYDEVVPHLTIADHGPMDEMRAAEAAVRRHLPINAIAQAVTLIVERPSQRWEIAESFPLRG